MNKFTQHIPNYCEGFEPEIFEFTDLDDLANKLGKDKSLLVFEDEYILSVSKDDTEWWVLGRVEKKIDGLKKWSGGKELTNE